MLNFYSSLSGFEINPVTDGYYFSYFNVVGSLLEKIVVAVFLTLGFLWSWTMLAKRNCK